MASGLGERNAVGRVGAYREGIWTEVVQVGTVVARAHLMFTQGEPAAELLSLPVGPAHRRELLSNSWTGRSWRYADDRGSVDLHLRGTLPGPLFSDFGEQLALRFAFGNAPDQIEDLERGTNDWRLKQEGLGRVLLLRGPRSPALLVCSEPVARYEAISHEHVTLTFARAGARVLWLPLLDEADIPADRERLELWLRLIEAPPVACQEQYEVAGDTVRIRQQFTSLGGARPGVVPLPPIAALVGEARGLQRLPAARPLCRTLLGPYALVEGDGFEWSIDTAWMRAKVEPSRPIDGPLAQNLGPIPEELTYAGDVSWEPGSPMDQFLSIRVWAPLAGIMPKDLWARLKPMLTPPTPEAFRRSLRYLKEPFTGSEWAKDAAIFGERHEVSYDSDWYNGLTLSGLERGIACADPDISAACQAFAAECRRQRELLAQYMWIFQDWAVCCAWTDPRGELIDFDCAHNGMEGLIAEMRMRRREGDAAGADRVQYLAAKESLLFVAAFPLADWARQVKYVIHDEGGPAMGVSHVSERRGFGVQTASARAPYPLAGHFPEFCCLLRRHADVERIRLIAGQWKSEHGEKYDDWDFYVTRGRHNWRESRRQGDRTANAVFYLVAPEICTRLWVLGEDPDEVERLFRMPPSLAEQLWCRCGARVREPG